jgi:hypothetical protein
MPKHSRSSENSGSSGSSGSLRRDPKIQKENSLCHQCTPIDRDINYDIIS